MPISSRAERHRKAGACAGRRIAFWLLALLLLVWSTSPGRAEADATTAGWTSEQILEGVFKRMSAFEAAFPINESLRHVTIREQDPNDGEVFETRVIDQAVRGRVGENPTRKIESCRIDGESVEPTRCEDKDQIAAPLRIFGPTGADNYTLKLGGRTVFQEVESWRIRVVPREPTSRHFKGDLFVAVDDLRLLGSEGTLADLPFGVESLAVHLCFEEIDQGPVVKHGKIDVTLYVPVIVHKRLVSEFEATQQRLLPAAG